MIERWFEPFTLLGKERVSDYLGGECTKHTPVLDFQGVLTLTCGESTTLAEQPAVAEAFVLLHEFDVTLSPGDCVRRKRDGAVYRVGDNSNNMRAPAFSGLQFAQVPVERMVLPC